MARTIIMGLSLFITLCGHSHPTSQMRSTVKVNGTCQITTYNATRWPSLSGTFTSNIDNTSGYVSAQCSMGLSYSLGLDNGQNYDSTAQMRRLTNRRGAFIKYAIYKNSGFSSAWGQVGTANALSLMGSGSVQTSTLYARIPSGQPSAPSGFYQDMVAVTLNF